MALFRWLQKHVISTVRETFSQFGQDDGYLLAAERLGAAPARCLVLEDAPAGIRAAFDAGMIPVMIPDLVPPDAETLRLLYCQCATLNDVLPLIG